MTETDPRFADGTAFIDGDYCPKAEARISVFDMGFLLSDATYDVAHVWRGTFFRLDDHLDRFAASCAKLRYTLPYDRGQIRDILIECVLRTGREDAMVSMIATRGSTTDGRRDLRKCRNTFLAFALPFVWIVEPERIDAGVHAAISTVRRIPPDSVDPTVKNFNRLDFSQALFEAYDRGAEFAILTDGEGHVTEGLGYNVFALSGGRLLSPDAGVLEGVTRRTILEMAAETNVKAELAEIAVEQFKAADEIFMASTAGGIMPVTRLDGRAVGDGSPGPLTIRLKDMYWAWHDKPAYRTSVYDR